MSGHDHVIDCIAWAGIESARIIEGANYSGGDRGSFVENNAEFTIMNDENGNYEESKEENKESGEPLVLQIQDDSRANLQARMTTK